MKENLIVILGPTFLFTNVVKFPVGITSRDGKSLYVIGGQDNKVNIFKLENGEKWIKLAAKLKTPRETLIALPISNSLADKLCN